MYKVYTHWTPNNMVYVGVTSQDLKLRWRPSQYKGMSLYPYIEKFGWENIKHEVIYTCEDKEEAYQVEEDMRQYYEDNGCCINKQRSGLIKAKDENEYMRQYRQDNPEAREKHKELCRKWRQDHKEEQAEYHRQYYKDHPVFKEKEKERKRQWYLKKKAEKLKQAGQFEMPIAV